MGLGAGLAPAAGPGQRSDTVGITGADYDAFERTLGEVQAAYSNEDLAALRAQVTPELLSYFSEDLAQNASRGVVNRVSDVKLLKGDLSEAWREGDTDYATVAMQFSIHDWMENRSGQVVDGDPSGPSRSPSSGPSAAAPAVPGSFRRSSRSDPSGWSPGALSPGDHAAVLAKSHTYPLRTAGRVF